MHWSVGMLLHAVCFFCCFFSKEKKKEPVKKIGTWECFPDTFSSQHGAVDLDYIPFMSPLDLALKSVPLRNMSRARSEADHLFLS